MTSVLFRVVQSAVVHLLIICTLTLVVLAGELVSSGIA